MSALTAAQAGDVIQLAAGTYTPIKVTGLNFTGTVTITSADPAHIATLQGLNIQNSQNMTFRGLEFVVNPTAGDAQFNVGSSQNIAFDQLNVHGTLDGNPQNDAAGVIFRYSTNVSVTNSEFHELKMAVSHDHSTGVLVANSYFHNIRMDGVRGGGSQNVTVKDNFFTDFHPVAGDHSDAIQFWTTNTTRPGTDIVVSGNTIVRGDGSPMQGLFMRDELLTQNFQRVTVTNNIVVGGLYNGIAVNNAHDVVIKGNTVAGLPDQTSWITSNYSTNVAMSNNTATKYSFTGSTNLVETGDVTINSPTDGGKMLQQAWLSSHSGGTSVQSASIAISFAGVTTAGAAETVTALNAAATAAFNNIEAERIKAVTINGTTGADRLYADQLHDSAINGLDGNDNLVSGGIGHNTMSGGLGDDTYTVNSVYDKVVELAGQGIDTVIANVDHTLTANVERLRMGGNAVVGNGNDLDNRMTGNAVGNKMQAMAGHDDVQSLGGDDTVSGGDGNDSLDGGAGNDVLSGDNGNDRLFGDIGDDSIAGGAGNDIITGGIGADTLSGGAGQDTFGFRAGDLTMTGDRITDFSHAEGDRIDLTQIDADTTKTGDQAFKFIGSAAFTKVAGQLHVTIINGVPVLSGDVNGDGLADFQLHLPGASNLSAGDFAL